ncbi:YopX family protein [Streptococcus suis]|uniref:YopX family protein n=1 Tax=Streptococcus suis TaxID=1307 RepID=UPI0038B9340B
MIPKFRAWDKIRNRISEVERIYIDTKGVRLRDENGEYWRRFDDVILMQSTGLFDINGKEIFEGDIVRMHSGELLPVKLHHGMFEPVCYYISNVFERVGNVFENPELLEHPDFREVLND